MKIKEMGIANPGFLVEKLASDCSPRQYLRELTVNSIQAILARINTGWQGEGCIIWDVDWDILEAHGAYKLRISDNGTGMSEDDVQKYINHLSSSGRVQGLAENYGLGAKITAAVHSPQGLVYKTWQNNVGVMAVMKKDENGNYGLDYLDLGDGEWSYVPKLESEGKRAEPIDDSGTSVTMMGTVDEIDTFLPQGTEQKWVIKYLNNRFFRIPGNIKIKARNFRYTDRTKWPFSPDITMTEGGSQLRTINGMEANLIKNSEASGIVEARLGKIHWWLLREDIGKQTDIWESRQHTAVLFQDELYEFASGNSAFARLREFGVILGTNRVVLYVEPDELLCNVTPLTSRERVRINESDVDWQYWAKDFRANIPDEIQSMMDSIAQRSGSKSHKDAIKKWLKEFGGLFKISRFRYLKGGPDKATEHTAGGAPGNTGATREPNGKNNGGGSGGSAASLYGAVAKAGGMDSEQIKADTPYPDPKWISQEDGSRAPGDLEDKAARYLQQDHTIHINADFRVIRDLINLMVEESPVDSESEQHLVIAGIIKDEIAIQLVETVMGTLALQGSPEWPADAIDKALSEEALTAAVMQRSSTIKTARRVIGGRLGGTKKT